MNAFATASDVMILSGKNYTADEIMRIDALLPLISDALRAEAHRAGRDLDQMIENYAPLENTARLVTVDILIRVMRQSWEGNPMTQESQAALGYSYSGTYSIPGGGGIAAAIMNNDLKRLGIKKPRIALEGKYSELPDPVCG